MFVWRDEYITGESAGLIILSNMNRKSLTIAFIEVQIITY